jgi:hypothetical protein
MNKQNIFRSDKIKINIDKNLRNKSKIISKKEYYYVLENFKKYGVLNFSNITSSIENLSKFIDLFSKSYSNDAQRRKIRFNNSNIRNVDIGNKKILLHSETSFSPSRPEIIWFYCINPPKTNSGKTILCDGANLWDALSTNTKNFFLGDPICYSLKIPINNKIKGKGKRAWYLNNPGVKNCYLNFDDKSIEFKYVKFAVQESLYLNKLCFSNHLFVPLESEPQILSRKMYNGKAIPKKIINEIHKKAENLTKAVRWVKNDLLMIDNFRFMHGRETIDKKENLRDIVTMQTAKSNFNLNFTSN